MGASENASYNAETTTLGTQWQQCTGAGHIGNFVEPEDPTWKLSLPNGPQMEIWNSIEGPNRKQKGQNGNFDSQRDKMETHPFPKRVLIRKKPTQSESIHESTSTS